MKLLLVRHGQTTSNVSGALDTAFPGADLTEVGHAQARALPERLRGIAIDALAHSPLVRTEQTIAPLARERNMTPLILPGLREVSAGDLEMHDDAASRNRYFSVVRSWFSGGSDVLAAGDTAEAICDRFDEAIDELAAAAHAAHAAHAAAGEPTREPTALAVAHGTVLGVWHAMRVEGMRPQLAIDHHLLNTEITVLTGAPGAWRIHAWGSHEFTPGAAIALLDDYRS